MTEKNCNSKNSMCQMKICFEYDIFWKLELGIEKIGFFSYLKNQVVLYVFSTWNSA